MVDPLEARPEACVWNNKEESLCRGVVKSPHVTPRQIATHIKNNGSARELRLAIPQKEPFVRLTVAALSLTCCRLDAVTRAPSLAYVVVTLPDEPAVPLHYSSLCRGIRNYQ